MQSRSCNGESRVGSRRLFRNPFSSKKLQSYASAGGRVGASAWPPAWLAVPSEAPAVAVAEDAEALAEWEAERRAIQEDSGVFDGPPPTHGPGAWLAELNRLMGRV